MSYYKLKATYWETSPKGNSITSKVDFLIDATDRTEAENRFSGFLKDAGASSVILIEGGEVDVLKVFPSEHDMFSDWFQARVLFRDEDEKTLMEKRSRHTVYVQASAIIEVCTRLQRELESMADYSFIESVRVTSIKEFLPSIQETEAQWKELTSI